MYANRRALRAGDKRPADTPCVHNTYTYTYIHKHIHVHGHVHIHIHMTTAPWGVPHFGSPALLGPDKRRLEKFGGWTPPSSFTEEYGCEVEEEKEVETRDFSGPEAKEAEHETAADTRTEETKTEAEDELLGAGIDVPSVAELRASIRVARIKLAWHLRLLTRVISHFGASWGAGDTTLTSVKRHATLFASVLQVMIRKAAVRIDEYQEVICRLRHFHVGDENVALLKLLQAANRRWVRDVVLVLVRESHAALGPVDCKTVFVPAAVWMSSVFSEEVRQAMDHEHVRALGLSQRTLCVYVGQQTLQNCFTYPCGL